LDLFTDLAVDALTSPADSAALAHPAIVAVAAIAAITVVMKLRRSSLLITSIFGPWFFPDIISFLSFKRTIRGWS
jgi:hypothetical protein